MFVLLDGRVILNYKKSASFPWLSKGLEIESNYLIIVNNWNTTKNLAIDFIYISWLKILTKAWIELKSFLMTLKKISLTAISETET